MRIPNLSKSSVKAMECEYHYVHAIMDPHPALHLLASPAALVGSQYHEFRRAYIYHLTWAELAQDPAWVQHYLTSTPLEPDARDMIARDAEHFTLSLKSLVGAEVYLSLDANLEPLDHITNFQFDSQSTSPAKAVTGIVDLLQRQGSTLVATDYKTSWSTANLEEYEAVHYAAMLFQHYPDVSEVAWNWYLPRTGLHEERRFIRADLPWLLGTLRGKLARRDEIIAKAQGGERLMLNPFAGLCGYCPLECPIRSALQDGALAAAIAPVQTAEDAERAAWLIQVGSDTLNKARAGLKAYLDQHGSVKLPGGYVAEMVPTKDAEYPVVATLEALGYSVAGENKYDVPLDKLVLGATKLKGYAKAQSRPGMAAAIEAAAVFRPGSDLKIRKVPEAPTQEPAPTTPDTLQAKVEAVLAHPLPPAEPPTEPATQAGAPPRRKRKAAHVEHTDTP
jgi:hypothetical protein